MEILFFLHSCLLIFTNLQQLYWSAVAKQNLEYPYPFMTVDASEAAARTYDYIVVGGGAAGCPLAATLSEHYSVLLLERGDSPYGNPDIEDKEGYFKVFGDPREFPYAVEEFVSDEKVQLVRGRVLGGGTAINSGFYSRASSEFIRKMEWDERLVNESFKWVEDSIVFKPDKLLRWNTAFKSALLEAEVLPYNGYSFDHLEGTKVSGSIFDNEGKRHTAADFLKNANPDNIKVLLNATASRILFSSGKLKATGVEFFSINDCQYYQVSTKSSSSEVILSAGSIGSPQLLLLSGIGPSDQLKKLNITVSLDLQSVGKDIKDPPRTNITIESSQPLEFALNQVVGILDFSQVDIESLSYFEKINTSKNKYIGIIFSKVAYPLSSGELRLNITNPKDTPFVKYNYFSHRFDVEECTVAVKKFLDLFKTIPMQEFTFNGTFRFIGPPLPQNTSCKALEIFCKQNVKTIWHYHGGCGVDSVTNKRFQVKGVESLRVVDFSIFKDSPGTNPQATIMMLGRYAGVQILKERMHICEDYMNIFED